MKMNKITAALVGLGIVSAAGVAQANTVIFLTGSTAARAYIYSTLTSTTDGLFTGGATVVAGTNANSSNQIVYEGTVSGISGTTDISCDFTGSEAGIASVANSGLTQDIPDDPNETGSGGDTSSYPLPGVGSAALFYQLSGTTWEAPSTLGTFDNSNDGNTYPDLTMADTSQAVSRTTSPALTPYGNVGIVPFSFFKGYETSPDSSWNDCVNITSGGINAALADGANLSANYITGNAADTDWVTVVGRNFGSGTRVNTLLNAASYALTTAVNQYAWNSGYPNTGGAAAEGVLTFGSINGYDVTGDLLYTAVPSPYAPGATMIVVGNDGFDGGGGVGANLNVDGNPAAAAANTQNNGSNDPAGFSPDKALPYLVIGYLGISDAQKALTDGNGGSAGGDCVPLTFNGVYEGDVNVENGSYTFWGKENLYGQNGQSGTSAAHVFATQLATQLETFIGTKGSATGNISSNASGQSLLVPTTKMLVSRGLDYGLPTQTGH